MDAETYVSDVTEVFVNFSIEHYLSIVHCKAAHLYVKCLTAADRKLQSFNRRSKVREAALASHRRIPVC